MKRKSFAITFLVALMVMSSLNANVSPKKNPLGKWKFSVPEAPYGYNTGIIEVKKVDDKYTVSMLFSDLEYKFEGEYVKFIDEKLSFSIYIEGEDIFIDLKFAEKNKLSGKASYSAGDLSISAEREK